MKAVAVLVYSSEGENRASYGHVNIKIENFGYIEPSYEIVKKFKNPIYFESLKKFISFLRQVSDFNVSPEFVREVIKTHLFFVEAANDINSSEKVRLNSKYEYYKNLADFVEYTTRKKIDF